MKRGKAQSIVTAIDIGTTKICVLIAALHDTHIEILGIGKAPSEGLARGVVVDIGLAVESIKAALEQAQLMAGVTVEAVVVGISGAHIAAVNSQGVIPLRAGVVRDADIAQVLAAARATPLEQGQQILHSIPHYFVIDGNHKVRDPRGMHGVRLEAQVHIITGGVSSVQNLIRCCQLAGVKVQDIILEPIASAYAVLSADERELGVGLLDIGGGTSDFALYQNSALSHTRILPIAGNLFTNDIAVCLRTTLKEAERIKKEFGVAHTALLFEDQTLAIEQIQGGGTRTITHKELASVIEPRAQELILMLHAELKRYHLQPMLQTGLVLTGGGALLSGLVELAECILQVPVRCGMPLVPQAVKQALGSPVYATGYGLLAYLQSQATPKGLDVLEGPLMQRVFSRMKSLVLDFF